jgi:spectinomycin phosphotransferase
LGNPISTITPSPPLCATSTVNGQPQIDAAALAYYRYERIIQDIALFSEQILAAEEGNRDRVQALQYLMSNFLPAGTVELAYRSERTQGDK